ncbi:MAG: hypothetical protein ABL915_06080, partial [Gallionella sp.]
RGYAVVFSRCATITIARLYQLRSHVPETDFGNMQQVFHQNLTQVRSQVRSMGERRCVASL